VDGVGAIRGISVTAAHFASPDWASIDWLNLDADKASRTGAFSDVGIIQRLYTGSGEARRPAAPPDEGLAGNALTICAGTTNSRNNASQSRTTALYNSLSTFSATHYVTPRAITAMLGFHF